MTRQLTTAKILFILTLLCIAGAAANLNWYAVMGWMCAALGQATIIDLAIKARKGE